MDEYMYAGEDWSPEVDDVCEAISHRSLWEGWIEVVIMEIDHTSPFADQPYIIDGPSMPRHSPGKRRWVAPETALRKKRPPRQDNKLADEDFITDLKSLLNREGVKA